VGSYGRADLRNSVKAHLRKCLMPCLRGCGQAISDRHYSTRIYVSTDVRASLSAAARGYLRESALISLRLCGSTSRSGCGLPRFRDCVSTDLRGTAGWPHVWTWRRGRRVSPEEPLSGCPSKRFRRLACQSASTYLHTDGDAALRRNADPGGRRPKMWARTGGLRSRAG